MTKEDALLFLDKKSILFLDRFNLRNGFEEVGIEKLNASMFKINTSIYEVANAVIFVEGNKQLILKSDYCITGIYEKKEVK